MVESKETPKDTKMVGNFRSLNPLCKPGICQSDYIEKKDHRLNTPVKTITIQRRHLMNEIHPVYYSKIQT